MYNNKCLTKEKFLSLVADPQTNESFKYKKHIESCKRCTVLYKAFQKGLSAKDKESINFTKELLNKESPKKVLPGQVWRLSLNKEYGGEYPVIVITKGTEISLDNEKQDVRGATFNFYVPDGLIGDDDIIISESDSPFRKNLMIEYWNERPFSVESLEKYIGELSKKAFNDLENRLRNHEANITANPIIEKFRESRIKKSTCLSIPSMKRAMEFMALDETEKNSLEIVFQSNEILPLAADDVSENPEIKLNFIYKKLISMENKFTDIGIDIDILSDRIIFNSEKEFSIVFEKDNENILQLDSKNQVIEFKEKHLCVPMIMSFNKLIISAKKITLRGK